MDANSPRPKGAANAETGGLRDGQKSSSKEIDDFINEGISSILLGNQEYGLENLGRREGTPESHKPSPTRAGAENSYLNCILKSEDAKKSPQTHGGDDCDARRELDAFCLSPFGQNELAPNDSNYIKNLENQLYFFGNSLDAGEAGLSGQLGLADKASLMAASSSTNYDAAFTSASNSPYANNGRRGTSPEFPEDKSEKNSNFARELSYGEHVIYNKIDTLQRMVKSMVVTIHEKHNSEPNARYEAAANEAANEPGYDFALAQAFAQRTQKRSSLKLLASHGVIGSFFGSSGHRVQALQQEFNVNVSVTTKRIHFPGSNNKGVLLISGKLHNVLRVLRPLYRAIQEEVIRLLIDEAVRIEPAQIRLEIEVLIPESLRFTMDRNKHFKQIMDLTGANIRVIKQTYEDGPVQERVLVLFGTQTEIELTLEKVALMIQEDSGYKHYGYMNYPDLTIALNANDYALRYQRKQDPEARAKKASRIM